MKNNDEIIIRGIPVSSGIDIARASVAEKKDHQVSAVKVCAKDVTREISRFEEARISLIRELEESKKQADPSLKTIIETQRMLLKDRELRDKVYKYIRRERRKAEYAVYKIFKEIALRIKETSRGYLSERAKDFEHLAKEIVERMSIREKNDFYPVKGRILVKEDLSIQETLDALKAGVSSFILKEGGKTSHSALILKDFKKPAIFGVGEDIVRIKDGDLIILDGIKGEITLNPSDSTLERYKKLKSEFDEYSESLRKLKDVPAETLDGKKILLHLNIDFVDELNLLGELGKTGIGLFRTETLFNLIDDETTQKKIYEELSRKVYPNQCIVRAFDIGGDKILKIRERNPFLGLRGIRVLLKEKDIFKRQIRAVIKANKLGNIQFMLPMISTVEEVRESKKIYTEVYTGLKRKSIKLPPLGIMIETPSSVEILGDLCKYIEFISIGTNDLTQYILAVDRRSPKVSYLYEHLHPAIIKTVYRAVKEAKKRGIWVGVCGEMASDPSGILILIAMGVDELSVTPSLFFETKEIIRGVSQKRLISILKKCTKVSSSLDVKRITTGYLRENFPLVLKFIAQEEFC